MNALFLESLTARYPGSSRPALDGATLSVAAGERIALLGLNGSGKTTLLNAVVGLVPFTGTAEVCGIPVCGKRLREVRARIGFLFGVPDDQILFPNVLEDVAYSLRQRGVPKESRESHAQAVLASLGIADLAAASPYTLSQGQRQRVALAGVLAGQPDLLLLDEPSASLDPVGQAELVRLLQPLPSALIMATHDIAFAERICSRFVLLDSGRILSDSPVLDSARAYFNKRTGATVG